MRINIKKVHREIGIFNILFLSFLCLVQNKDNLKQQIVLLDDCF